MKIIVLIMLAVVVIDAAVAAVFFQSAVLAGFAGAVALGAVALARTLKRAPMIAATGWQLGVAKELTNPDMPTTWPNAILTPKTLNLGMLVIGAPGAGKTESVMLGYLDALGRFAPNGGWAFFEGKGDIDIYKKAVSMGRPPRYFFSTELEGSDTINLFAGEPSDVVDRLSMILIGETLSTSFYMEEQRAVLTRIVPLLLRLPEPTNLRDFYVALCDEDAGGELIRRARDAGADPVDLTLARQWLSKPFEERVKNIAGLLNRLFIFVAGARTDRLNAYAPNIDIAKIVAAGETVYFHIPLTQYGRDVAIAIVETFGVEARKRQLGGTDGLISFPLLFDDWGKFFHKNFGPFSARCRSAAMPLSFGFQSKAQLEDVGPIFADELDDTIATKIILRIQGEATSEYASRLLGQFDTLDVGASQSSHHAGSNINYGRRFRIEPRQLRELQAGEAYISTLAELDGKTVNPLWRLRFPLPPFADWRAVPMPAKSSAVTNAGGLDLWNRYMNPMRLSQIHTAVEQAVKATDTDAKAAVARERDAERAAMRANAGLQAASGE